MRRLLHVSTSARARAAAIAVLLAAAWTAAPKPAAADVTIGGVVYGVCGQTEHLTAPFFTADAAVTSATYQDYVLVKVSGTGQSKGTDYNDAFYVYANGAGGSIGPFNTDLYYELSVGTATLVPYGRKVARNLIVHDVDVSVDVTPPYVPAYRADHTYTFVIAVAGPAQLHFGVSDGIFGDNSGQYDIDVTQLNALPVITANAPVVLWSPNHNLVDVSSAFSVSDPDSSGVTYSVKVYSNEPEVPAKGDGTGNFAPDYKDGRSAGRGILVRAERQGPGAGRFYIGVITASDGCNTVESTCVLAVVPHDATAASLSAVQAAANAALTDISSLFQHGLAAPLGPKQ